MLTICYINSMSTTILYEQPLNEKVRILLRLEHFFSLVGHFQQGISASDTHAGVLALIEILAIIDRNDVRNEVLKELDRQIQGLSRLLDTPTVDKLRLDQILDRLTAASQNLQKSPSKISPDLRENELLSSIRQRSVISAGTCSFDLPAYHYWLNQDQASRYRLLSRWIDEFNPLKEGIHLLLSLLRNSSEFETQLAEAGSFQKALDPQVPCQLLRIQVPNHSAVFPEVSGNKHRVNVRFLGFSESGRAKQIEHHQPFEISFCTI